MGVNCNKCNEIKETAGQVRSCGYCRNDGTGNEIPKTLADDTTMLMVLAHKPGLSARFAACAVAAMAVDAAAAETEPEPTVDLKAAPEAQNSAGVDDGVAGEPPAEKVAEPPAEQGADQAADPMDLPPDTQRPEDGTAQEAGQDPEHHPV